MRTESSRAIAILLGLLVLPAVPMSTTAGEDEASKWQPAPTSPSGAAVWGLGGSSTTLVASTMHNGAFYSNDNGRSWFPAATDVDEGEVAFDPSAPDRGYLAGFGGMDRTTDGGATWTKVIDESPVQRVDVADDGTVAAAVRIGWSVHLYVSSDAGDTWDVRASPLPEFSSAYAVVFGESTQHIVMMTISKTWVSQDGGATWTETGDGGRDLVYADGAFWATGFSGVHRSTDGGFTWTTVSVPGGAPKVFTPRPGGGLYGASGNGVVRTLDGGATWANMGYGYVAFAATALLADPEDPDAVLMGDENMGVNRIHATSDGYAFEGRNAGFPPVPVTAFGGAPDGSVLLAGGALGMYASRDDGKTWSHAGAGVGYPGMHAVAANADGSALFAGGRTWILQAYLQVSHDDGRTWQSSLPDRNDSAIAAFASHPTDPDRVWAALWVDLADSHVLETTDGGRTWTRAFTTPHHVADVAYHEPTDTLLVATDVGVFARQDGASAFVPIMAAPAGARFVETAGDVVVAEGQGTSVWRNHAALPVLAPWADTGDALTTLAVAPSGTAWAGAVDGTLYQCGGVTPLDCVDDTPSEGVRVAWVDTERGLVWAGTDSEGLFVADVPS